MSQWREVAMVHAGAVPGLHDHMQVVARLDMVPLQNFSLKFQEQHAEMSQQREAAAVRADAAEGALRDERLRSSMAASKWQDQLHQ